MKLLEKIEKIFNKMNTSGMKQDEVQIVNEKQLNEFLAEERNRKKLLDEKLLAELQAKNRDEEQRTNEKQLNEFLAEERNRKKILDEKLLAELQIKKHDEKISHELDIKNRNEKQKGKRINKRQEIAELFAISKKQDEQKQLGKNKTKNPNKKAEPFIDTRFIYQEEVTVTNIGPDQLRYDHFSKKIGYTPKKKE